MTPSTIRRSGSSESWPAHVAYPSFIPFAAAPELKNCFCYVLAHYRRGGTSVLIERRKTSDDVIVKVSFGDWDGTVLNPTGNAGIKAFAADHLRDFVATMKFCGVPVAQFYLSDDFTLVDMRVGHGKLTGPGMVRDMFGKICKTQNVLKIVTLDEPALKALAGGTGSYSGDLIIKPSAFKTVEREKKSVPLYVEVVRG